MKKKRLPKNLLFILILLSFIFQHDKTFGKVLVKLEQNNDSYTIVSSNKQSELQKFASWFHQDWDLVFSDFFMGAKMYFNSLPNERLEVLEKELELFIKRNKNATLDEVEEAWLLLGAQAFQPDLDIKKTLDDFSRILKRGEWGDQDRVILP